MTSDGGLNRWEVMGMTNLERKVWIDLMTEKAKAQKEAYDKAKSSKGSMPRK